MVSHRLSMLTTAIVSCALCSLLWVIIPSSFRSFLPRSRGPMFHTSLFPKPLTFLAAEPLPFPIHPSSPLSLSSSSSSPTTTSFWSLLRSPLSHHGYASLFDKLHRGEPIRVAVLGGSISEQWGWFIRNNMSLGYFNQLHSFLNTEFPVHPSFSADHTAALARQAQSPSLTTDDDQSILALHSRLTRFDRWIDHRDPDRKSSPYSHKVINFAAGGTSTQSTSFCWSSLFSGSVQMTEEHDGAQRSGGGRAVSQLMLPDLLLIDDAVNDGGMAEGDDGSALPSFPLSPLHSFDRLIRSLLTTSHDLHQPVAIVPLFFSSAQANRHRSVQAAHDRVARHYGIHSVSFRDHVTHPAVRMPLPVEEPEGMKDKGHYFEGEETIHPNPQGHNLMAQLLIRELTRLYDNYQASQRSSLADGWMLSGKVASTSVRMKDRPSAVQQPEDEVAEVTPLNIDRAWRVKTDIPHSEVEQWQATVGRGQETTDMEMILPAILSTEPLPLPPALHPLNQHLPSSFHCRKTYMIYIGDHVYQPYDHIESWLGIVHPTPQPSVILPPRARNTSVDHQWLFGSTPKHPAKFTVSPHPDYLSLVATQPDLPLPSMTIVIPVVRHSASLFYLRTWQAMAYAEAHLFCSTAPEVRSVVQVLNGTWSSPTSQASATTIYCRQESEGQPPCYDRIHIQMKQAGDFRIIGWATA